MRSASKHSRLRLIRPGIIGPIKWDLDVGEIKGAKSYYSMILG